MEKNNLDQFFKDKLSTQQWEEPSEEAWLSARAALGLPRRKKRGLIFWWIGLLILGLFAGYLIYRTVNMPDVQVAPANRETASTDNPIPDQSTAEEITDLSKQADMVVAPSNQKQEGSIPIPSHKLTNQFKPVPETNVKASRSGKSIMVERVDDVEDVGQPTPGLIDDIPDKYPELRPERSPQIIPDLIAMRIFRPESTNSASKPESGLTPIFDRPKHSWRYGYAFSVLANPGEGATQTWQGVLAGITAEYVLGKHLSVGVRPAMQITLNENGYSAFQVNTRYSFSSETETFGLRASSLQFLRLPAYLALHMRRHTLELGGGMDWLLAARGQVQQIEVQDQDVSPINQLSSGWLPTDQMQQLSTHLFVGYKFQINYRLRAGTMLYYRPNRIFPGLPNEARQPHRKWFMGFQINYFVK